MKSITLKHDLPVTAWALGLAGLLPFVVLGISAHIKTVWDTPLSCVLGHQVLNTEVVVGFFIAYSAVILAFLSGTLWAAALLSQQKSVSSLFVASNTFALLAWVASTYSSQLASILLLVLGFALILLKEHKILRVFPSDYRIMRYILTVTVFVAHVIVAFAVV